MKYSVSPVVRVAVQLKKSAELLKLVEEVISQIRSIGLVYNRRFRIKCISRMWRITCRNMLERFRKRFCQYSNNKIRSCFILQGDRKFYLHLKLFVWLNPLIIKIEYMLKLNKFKRIFIERGNITTKDNQKERAKLLSQQYDWDKDDALRIWAFGPDNSGPNILLEKSSGVQYMNEIRDLMDTLGDWQPSNDLFVKRIKGGLE